jgi:hypothetical protein
MQISSLGKGGGSSSNSLVINEATQEPKGPSKKRNFKTTQDKSLQKRQVGKSQVPTL